MTTCWKHAHHNIRHLLELYDNHIYPAKMQVVSLQRRGTPKADEDVQATLVLPDLDVHRYTRNIREITPPNVGHLVPKSLGMARVEEVAAGGRIDDVLEELVDIRQVSQQRFRPWHEELGLTPPVLATDALYLVGRQAQELEVGLYCEARGWDHLEHGIADRRAEVLEQGRVLGGGHQEEVAHEVADVVLHP